MRYLLCLIFNFSFALIAFSQCIDSLLIDPTGQFTSCIVDESTLIDIVCGCDSITYINQQCALQNGVLDYSAGPCSCIETKYINEEYDPFDFEKVLSIFDRGLMYNPVCGCDSVTYINKHHAILSGVAEWEEGACRCKEDVIDIEVNVDSLEEAHYLDRRDPVCGCDGVIYNSPEEAYFYHGVVDWYFGQCFCIDSMLIDITHECDDVYEPVCGCDGQTYNNSCIAQNKYGIPTYSEGICDCIDQQLIDSTELCLFDVYEPVCGCDGSTYLNECVAKYRYGVGFLNEGPCNCFEERFLDTTALCSGEENGRWLCGCDNKLYSSFCDAFIKGITEVSICDTCIKQQLIDSSIICESFLDYNPICGCDNVSYINYCQANFRYGVTSYSNGPCPDICEHQNLIINEIECPDLIDPVCGCNDVTYDNECIAQYKHGVLEYTKGKCVTSLTQTDNKVDVSLFPNPVFNNSITLSASSETITKLELFDHIGNSIPFKSSFSNGSIQISYDDCLSSGLYILRFMVGKNYQIKTFIKI